MDRAELLHLAELVLRQPTAPYHEGAVRAIVLAQAGRLGLPVTEDRHGNLLVRYRRPPGKRAAAGPPLVLVAHMDHPGFEYLGANRAEFLGGVPRTMFAGARVRFWLPQPGKAPAGGSRGSAFAQGYGRTSCSPSSETTVSVPFGHDAPAVQCRVKRLVGRSGGRRKVVELQGLGGQRLPRGASGCWDVPQFRVRDDRLTALGIDDVLSVAVILATLTELVRQRVRTHVWGVFTRAEEVGFHGAVELARARTIPRQALVVSVEMSRERPWARLGRGPVVRVGDRMSVFDPQGLMLLQEAVKNCVARDPGFRAQRALMDGGSCEATAFAAFGYRVAGLCLALGNYHNIGPGQRPRAEYVSVRDLCELVELTTAAARGWPRFKALPRQLERAVLGIRRLAPRVLRPLQGGA